MIYGILLTAAALLIVFIAALLIILWAVPVTFTGRVELCRDVPTLIFAFCISWGALFLQTRIPEEGSIDIILFGRTLRQIPLEAATREKYEPEVHKEEKEPVREKEEVEEEKPLPDIIGIAGAVLSQAGAILHQISIPYIRASLRFGLGDAALTGELFGLLMALRGMLMTTGGRVSLIAEAEFDEQVIEGDMEGAIRIAHPLSLVPPVVRIIRHPAVWKMVRSR